MSNLQISSSEIESKLREANKILREHLKDQYYTVDLQQKVIECLENEIINLKISKSIESKKVSKPKHLKIV